MLYHFVCNAECWSQKAHVLLLSYIPSLSQLHLPPHPPVLWIEGRNSCVVGKCSLLGTTFAVLLDFIMPTQYNLGSPGKREAQLKNCLLQISPWPCLWETVLIHDWYEKAQSTVASGSGLYKKGSRGRPRMNQQPVLLHTQFVCGIYSCVFYVSVLACVRAQKPEEDVGYISITLYLIPLRRGSLSNPEARAKVLASMSQRPPPSLLLTVLELEARGMFTKLSPGTWTQVLNVCIASALPHWAISPAPLHSF